MDVKVEGVSWSVEAVKQFKSQSEFVDHFNADDRTYRGLPQDIKTKVLEEVYRQCVPTQPPATKKPKKEESPAE